ncbi:SDR family NAD(P)-dependent oxidoreductase [Acidisoma cellulosilytica]|uniref:SDR family NAD(P)-dependent oxidoreductase n=1 Tax=Acidisoma cellulosilyticum TaxID=2802395 RepID=A0A963Z4S5_9PROT|nr:NAD-dependent epimerase/dehydratase family protein [Acidisoma cellulosilyticum]MCB8882461.1 SDR family NAD(P)-dependent oxidoreductase [Acidisoma cellulosilyticum]
MTLPVAALTGGTGFLGRYIAQAFVAAGWRIRLLTRGAPIHPMLEDLPLDLVLGGLDDARALTQLVADADVVIHGAGLVKARSRAEFLSVNRDGAARVAAIVARAPQSPRLVMISSLAARAPALSLYAESKRAGEEAVRALLDETRGIILRPSAIYGPWDREGLAILRLAAGRFAPAIAAPEPRIAMIHARDAAAAALAVATSDKARGTYDIADARWDGYGWRELLGVIGGALGRAPIALSIPDAVLQTAGAISDGFAAWSGQAAIFGRGKVREILHRDWSIDPANLIPADLWQPVIDLETGMRETAAWWLSTKRP